MRVDVVSVSSPWSPPPSREVAPARAPESAPLDTVSLAASAPEPARLSRVSAAGLALLSLVAVGAPALAQAAATVPQPAISQVSADRPLPYAREHVTILHGDAATRQKAIDMAENVKPHGEIFVDASSFSGADAARLTDVLTRKIGEGVNMEVRVGGADSTLVERLRTAGVPVSDLPANSRGSSISVDGRVLHGAYAFTNGDAASTSTLLERADNSNAWVRPLRNDATHHETREALLAHIRGARASIFIEAHGINDGEIFDALRSAADQGISVNVLLNHTAGDFGKGFNNLRAAMAFSEPNHQVPFRWYDGNDLTSMTAVFDSQTILVAQQDWAGGQPDSRDLLINDHKTAEDVKFDMMMDWQQHGTFAPVRSPFLR